MECGNVGVDNLQWFVIGVLIVLASMSIWLRHQAIIRLKAVETQNSHMIDQMAKMLDVELRPELHHRDD